jgi:hypothetical protein
MQIIAVSLVLASEGVHYMGRAGQNRNIQSSFPNLFQIISAVKPVTPVTTVCKLYVQMQSWPQLLRTAVHLKVTSSMSSCISVKTF